MSTPQFPPVPPSPSARPQPPAASQAAVFEGEPMGELSRVGNIFFEPAKVFADLKRKPSWWLPWVLLSVLSLVFAVCVQQRVGFDKITQTNIAHNARESARLDALPAAQKAAQIHAEKVFTEVLFYSWPVMLLLSFVIVGVLLLGIYNFGFGAKLRFADTLAVTAWSSLTGLIRAPLAIITLYLSEPDGYDINRPLVSNIGVLLNPQTHKFLATFLKGFDIFSICTILLMAIGLAQFSKVKRSTGFVTIFVIFLLFMLIMGGLATLS